MSTQLLTTTQAAQTLCVSRDSVLRLVRAGRLRAVNVGTKDRARLRIRDDDLQRFIDASTIQGGTA